MATKSNTAVNTSEENPSIESAENRFTKEQIISSKRYMAYTDILNTILGNRTYTFTEVDKMLTTFLTKEVD